jgi:hypothetical protein
VNRRGFLGAAGVLLVRPGQDTSQVQADRLYNAPAAGRSRAPIGELDNSEMVKDLERQLKCTCPCNLDVFTCRTTDFTCEYSPAMHREVMDLVRAGKNSEEIIAAFDRERAKSQELQRQHTENVRNAHANDRQSFIERRRRPR